MTPLEVFHSEKTFGVREMGKAGQCHCDISLQHLGKARAVREVPGALENADMNPVFQKGRKEDWDNDRLASLTREGDMTSPPAAICRRLKDKKGMAEDMWEGKEGDVVYPDFSKAFDMVFCSLRIARLLTAGLKKWTMWLVESCLSNDGGTSSVVQSPSGTHLLVASIKDQPLTTTMEHYYLSV